MARFRASPGSWPPTGNHIKTITPNNVTVDIYFPQNGAAADVTAQMTNSAKTRLAY